MFDEEIRKAVDMAGYGEDIADVLISLMHYMERKHWAGACYATASVLYVCLKELGYDPKLCIGEAVTDYPITTSFDHGWIELDGKIIDLACCMTLLNGQPASPPVIFDREIVSGEQHHIGYGYKGRGLDAPPKYIMSMPLSKYMAGFPNEKDGLLGVAHIVLGRKGSTKRLREKYTCNPWEYIQNDFDQMQKQRGG